MVYRYHKPPTQRQLKVGEEIRAVISEIILRGDIFAPSFEKLLVTVSEVRISSDLMNATVFLTFTDTVDVKLVMAFFNQMAPQIRKLVSAKVKLRFSPELKFIFDETSKQAAKIEELFKLVEKKDK
jgi:ribosome-binding factor A